MTTITEEAPKTWDDLVAEGIEVTNTITNRQWHLGDLAIEVAGPARTVEEQEGRGGKLTKYAEEIGVDYDQLRYYRVVATAWKCDSRHASVPWTLYRELYRREDREAKLTAFVAECEAKQIKPSYRALQAFLGKTPTPQYTERDRSEQVERGLRDMDPDERDRILRDFAGDDDDDDEREPERSQPWPPAPEPKAPKPSAHVTRNARYPEDAEHEWYTPPEYIEAAVAVMGGIDLDPATSELANDVVKAARIHTVDDDGLKHEWHGRIWMNPPYERNLVGRFCVKFAEELEAGRVTEAIILVNNSTDSQWWQGVNQRASAACFPKSRIRFRHPKDLDSNPLQGQVILYFGPCPDSFRRNFAQFGTTTPWDASPPA